MRSLFGRKLTPASWGEALVPEAKHGFQLQQLHRIFLTINVSNKSGHLLFAQTKAPSRRMTGVSVHPVQVQDTRVLHAVSIATALLAGCSSVTGDYESSISLAALLPILLPMQRSEVTRTLCAPLATGLRWSIFHPYSP